MKYKISTKDCSLIVKVKMSLGEKIDGKELDSFSRAVLRGFLKPRMVKKNQVIYTGPIGISMYERLKKTISKRDFLFIIEQIVAVVQKIHANDMHLNNLVLNMNYVFINEVTKEVQFIYMPTIDGVPNMSVAEFIETIVYSAKPSEEDDTEFVSRFIYYFKAMKQFDINLVEAFVAKEDKSVVTTIQKQNAGQSGFMTNKEYLYYEHYNKSADGMPDDATDLTMVLKDDDPTGLLVPAESEEDILTNAFSDDDATGLLTEDNEEETGTMNIAFPTLYRVFTGEVISINKPVFRIGKERSYVDYFVADNTAVSRGHADIITRGTKYYVIDRNSRNYTYINERKIPAHCEVEIHEGDRLKLGNEEFVFHE